MRNAGRAVMAITVTLVLVICLGIFFVLANANQTNMIVDFVTDIGRWLTTPFQNLFWMDNRDQAVLVNWGIAAVVYLFVGSALARLARRG
ncbi:hypothetical protein CryarDRAFT_1486 [Cryptosporangium arvum DSM 44712]|uniref:Integral membrane protein n=2 Tax=Cryptosporangium TaxID=65502 RepID=A0A010YYW7_9ACTN|nr:hypothetical protein CryarDRAFT_1486 [Cryptosporangium arvum DSM 44712]